MYPISALAISAILIFFSYRALERGAKLQSISLLFSAAFVLRFITSSHFSLYPWDERYHAVVAKNLMDNFLVPTLYKFSIRPFDFKNWMGNEIWLHKPPMPLWLIALSFKMFGVHELSLRAPSILMSSLCVVLTFKTALLFYEAEVAWIAALFQAIHGFSIELASGKATNDHVDTALLFFVQLSIFAALKSFQALSHDKVGVRAPSVSGSIVAGVASGFAVLTKWFIGLFPFALMGFIFLKTKSFKTRVLIFLSFACCVAVFLPWQLYIHNFFPNEAAWESRYSFLHITTVAEGHSGSVFYHLIRIPRLFGELSPLLILVWCASRLKKEPVLFLWFVIPYVFFSLVATKMPAYIMIASPAIFMMSAQGLFEIKNWIFVRWPENNRRIFDGVCFLVIGLLVRQLTISMAPMKDEFKGPAWRNGLVAIGKMAGDRKICLFDESQPIEAMFYTNTLPYNGDPSDADIQKARENGYEVWAVAENVQDKARLEKQGVYFVKLQNESGEEK